MTLYEIHAITFSVSQNINQSKKLSIIFSRLMNQSVSDAEVSTLLVLSHCFYQTIWLMLVGAACITLKKKKEKETKNTLYAVK